MPTVKARITKEVLTVLKLSAKDYKQPVTARVGDLIADYFHMDRAVHPKVGRPRKKGKTRG